MLRFGRHVVADQIGETFAVGGDDAKASRGCGKGDEHSAGADQLAQATGNEFEQAGDISLLEHAACELVERLELPNPVDCPLVDLHFFDRDAGLGGEKRHDLLVVFRELTTFLLGQVEISVHDSTHEDRDTKEAPHQRMPRREAEEMCSFVTSATRTGRASRSRTRRTPWSLGRSPIRALVVSSIPVVMRRSRCDPVRSRTPSAA